MNKFLQILILISFCVFIPKEAGAVLLYLEPSEGEFQIDDTFIVEVKIDTEGECINAIEVNLGYSKDILKAVEFSQGGSIVALWVQLPEVNQELGTISFSGGIPGGYCGEIPGDPGPSHLLGKIVFQVKQRKEAKIEFLEETQVLLNDGFGTPAELTIKGAVFTILSEKTESPKDEWQEELEKDTIPPEPFEIEISQDPAIFEGKYFIIFLTTDKQTGIAYYEVKEGERDWKRAESPYLLEDQTLSGIIKVKAVDKAGNNRIFEYIPSKKPLPWWRIILVLMIAVVGYWLYRKFKTLK